MESENPHNYYPDNAPQSLSIRGKVVVGVALASVALLFGGRTAEQVVDANGCNVEVTNNPIDPATAPFAQAIDWGLVAVHLEQSHDTRDCGQ